MADDETTETPATEDPAEAPEVAPVDPTPPASAPETSTDVPSVDTGTTSPADPVSDAPPTPEVVPDAADAGQPSETVTPTEVPSETADPTPTPDTSEGSEPSTEPTESTEAPLDTTAAPANPTPVEATPAPADGTTTTGAEEPPAVPQAESVVPGVTPVNVALSTNAPIPAPVFPVGNEVTPSPVDQSTPAVGYFVCVQPEGPRTIKAGVMCPPFVVNRIPPLGTLIECPTCGGTCVRVASPEELETPATEAPPATT